MAYDNTEIPLLKKFVRVEISKADGSFVWTDLVEYDGFDGAGNSVPKAEFPGGFRDGVRWDEFRFGPPQPAWEKFKYKSEEPVATTFHFEAWSTCKKIRPDDIKKYTLDVGYFGASGAMAGPQRITSILVFPSTNSVDTSIAPTFSFPPASGSWTAQFVNVDPDGDPRPRGGVRWSTTGARLGPDVPYSAGFSMHELQPELRYDLYAFDSAVGQYEQHLLDLSSSTVPSLGFYGLVCLAALLMGGGLLMLRRT